jgi:large subunit ribosomal protein L21
MYAIVEVAGKQYKVSKNAEFTVDRLDAKVGKSIKVKHVLLFSDGKKVEVGSPFVKDAEITCDVVGHLRGKKVEAFKYKRRKGQKKLIGHRRDVTRLKVKEIKAK